ncbi:hypothetical protein SAMN05216238_10897 [Lentibacillus persicus]|uniref:Uncharacterized protein n=1 Tax=Lentibacillus persicus TaxID=640948 RepID=A0A1I1XS94_9BACI|nr:hypothetical protein SAMN05216238_10897 [Lentibacillus persicus]
MFRNGAIWAGTGEYVPERRNMGRSEQICSGAAKYVPERADMFRPSETCAGPGATEAFTSVTLQAVNFSCSFFEIGSYMLNFVVKYNISSSMFTYGLRTGRIR